MFLDHSYIYRIFCHDHRVWILKYTDRIVLYSIEMGGLSYSVSLADLRGGAICFSTAMQMNKRYNSLHCAYPVLGCDAHCSAAAGGDGCGLSSSNPSIEGIV